MAQFNPVLDKIANSQDANAARMKEILTLLQKMAISQLDSFEKSMTAISNTPELAGPIKRKGEGIDFHREFFVNASRAVNDDVQKIVDDIFNIGKGPVRDSFQSIVKRALSSFFGSAAASEHHVRKSTMAAKFGDVVRIDYLLWSYHLESANLVQDVQDVFAVGYCESLIDLEQKGAWRHVEYVVRRFFSGDPELHGDSTKINKLTEQYIEHMKKHVDEEGGKSSPKVG